MAPAHFPPSLTGKSGTVQEGAIKGIQVFSREVPDAEADDANHRFRRLRLNVNASSHRSMMHGKRQEIGQDL